MRRKIMPGQPTFLFILCLVAAAAAAPMCAAGLKTTTSPTAQIVRGAGVVNLDHLGSVTNQLSVMNIAVPEPVSVLLSGVGLLALGLWGRRSSR